MSTTQSSWLNFMWNLHNKVRNGRGVKLTGLGALNEINNFLLLFFIERKFKKYSKLDDTCRFSYIYEKFCSPKAIKEDEELENKSKRPLELPLHKRLFIHYSDTSNMQCVLRKLLSDPDIKSYLKNEVTSISAYTDNVETGKTIQDVIIYIHDHFEAIAKEKNKTIDKLSLDDFGFDAFGDAYEKFKQQSCEDSGKSTGQHFTPDLVKDYIIKEMDPKDHEIFYEPACGTGGFIHKSMKYIKNKGGDYKKFCSNLMANECNPEIYKPLSINMLIHDIPIDKISKKDSLNSDYIHNVKNKFDICLTNPPFGGDGNVESDPEYWGPLQRTKNTVVKKLMAQFLMHIYHSLKKKGRCGTVSDRGIIYNSSDNKNSWAKDLRKFLLENTNLYRIVLLPKETFDYTSFSTCILFFVKGEKTKEVEFRDLKFKETTIDGQKTFVIDPDSDKPIIKVPIEKIVEKGYSLQLDDYIEKPDQIKKTGDKWIKFENFVNFHIGGTPSRKEGKYWDGKNLWVSVSELKNKIINDTNEKISDEGVNNSSVKLIEKDSILVSFKLSIGKIGIAGKDMYCNEAIMFFKHSNSISNKYLYYWFNTNDISEKASGQIGSGSLNKTSIGNILIPNLSISHQEEIVKFFDEQFVNYDINKMTKETPLFDLLIRKEYKLAEDLLYMIYREIDMREQVEKIKKDRLSIFNINYNLFKGNKENLGKLIKYLPKKMKLKAGDAKITGKYRFYSSSQEKILFYDSYEFEEKSILLGRGGSPSVHLAEKFSISHDDVYVIQTEKNIKLNYLYNFLLANKDKLIFTGNGLKHLSKENINKVCVNVPSLQDQETIIKKLDDFDTKTEPIIKYSEELSKDLELWVQGIKKYCEQEIEEDLIDSDNSDDSDDSDNSDYSDDLTNSDIDNKSEKSVGSKLTKKTNEEMILEELDNLPGVKSDKPSKKKINRSEKDTNISKTIKVESESDNKSEKSKSKSSKLKEKPNIDSDDLEALEKELGC